MLFPTNADRFESIFGAVAPEENNTCGACTIVIGEGSTPAAAAAAVAMSKLSPEHAQEYLSLITQNAPTPAPALPPTATPTATATEGFVTAEKLDKTLAEVLNLQDLRTLKLLKKRELKAASAIIMAAKTTSAEITAEMSKLEAANRKVDAATTECEVEAVTL
jgi:hypothetical protein